MPTVSYVPTKEAFLNSVVNKIGRQFYANKVFVNPLTRLNKGFVKNAYEVEEIYVAMADAMDWDKTGAGTLDRELPDVSTQYHQTRVQKQFKASVSDEQVRAGFMTDAGVVKIANEILASMSSGYEYWSYTVALEQLAKFANAIPATGKFTVEEVAGVASAKKFVKEIKKAMSAMTIPSTNFSTKQNFCKASDLVLFVKADALIEMDIELLSSAFNMEKTDFSQVSLIPVVDFGTGEEKTRAVLCDAKAIGIYDTYYGVRNQQNAEGRFTNYFLGSDKIFVISNWFCGAKFSIA